MFNRNYFVENPSSTTKFWAIKKKKKKLQNFGTIVSLLLLTVELSINKIFLRIQEITFFIAILVY